MEFFLREFRQYFFMEKLFKYVFLELIEKVRLEILGYIIRYKNFKSNF